MKPNPRKGGSRSVPRRGGQRKRAMSLALGSTEKSPAKTSANKEPVKLGKIFSKCIEDQLKQRKNDEGAKPESDMIDEDLFQRYVHFQFKSGLNALDFFRWNPDVDGDKWGPWIMKNYTRAKARYPLAYEQARGKARKAGRGRRNERGRRRLVRHSTLSTTREP